jgi:hypothetical protein
MVRALWPSPLAEQWAALYPDLFDAEDVHLTRSQPKNHFAEWFAAIHLFQRDGLLSLVEKYLFKGHPRKQTLLNQLLTPARQSALREISNQCGVQPPDLLVYTSGLSAVGFAEVKGPGDRLRDAQRVSHRVIEHRLELPVEVIVVRIVGAAT